MEILELQQLVDSWIKKVGVRYFSPLTNMAVLTEEVGEVARLMARKFGDQSTKISEDISEEALADELADIIWVVTAIANQTGIDLEEAIAKNIAKKSKRDGVRHIENEKLKD